MKKLILILAFSVLFNAASYACTSVIVSAKASASGKPVMFKNRDTSQMDNRMEHFKGPSYSFIGLVNSSCPGGEVWAGTNTAGFSVMNTASYNIKDDDIPASQMDREGSVMFKALGICRTVKDFENLLDTLPKPLGVEANFGVIDAFGGAAYYEVNNFKYVKFDVSQSSEGYRVVTNFSESGRREDYHGYERYLIASDVLRKAPRTEDGKLILDHHFLFDGLSRCYTEVDGKTVPRSITSSAMAIEGVKPGTDPCLTVMWTILGYPACSTAYPLFATEEDSMPYFVKSATVPGNSIACDCALALKEHIDTELQTYLYCCSNTDRDIDSIFCPIFNEWTSHSISSKKFFRIYKAASDRMFHSYLHNFASYSHLFPSQVAYVAKND